MKKFKALIPEAVADSVSPEHADKLMEKFTRIMNCNEFFAKRITDTTVGRDRLYAFMNHWLEAYNKTGKWESL